MSTPKVKTRDFIREMQSETELPAEDCKEAYQAVWATMERLLAEGKVVRVTGFGEFVKKTLPAETGKAFGNEYTTPERETVRYSPSLRMRKRLDTQTAQ